MQKLLKSNYSLENLESEFGMVQVNGQENTFGKIIQQNKRVCKISGYSKNEMRYENFKIFMNNIVKEWHDLFISEFFKKGRIGLINKRNTQFLQKQNGCIIPINLIVNYNFSLQFGINFVAFISKIKDFKLDSEYQIPVPSKQLMFILADN